MRAWTDTGGGWEIGYWIDSLAFNLNHSILYAGTVDHGVWAYDGTNWIDTGKVGITPELLSAQDQSFESAGVGDWYSYANATLTNSTDFHYGAGSHSMKQVAPGNGDSTASLMVTALTTAGQSYTATVQILTSVGVTARIYIADDVAASSFSDSFVGDGNWHTFTVTHHREQFSSTVMALGVEMVGAVTGNTQYIDGVSLTVAGYEILALAYDTINSKLYAGPYNPWTAAGFGVWKYSGGVWTDTGGGVAGFVVQALALDASSTYLYAGTMLHGVWKYNIGTSTWTDTGGGLSGYYIQSLVYDTVHGVLYASCSDNAGVGQGVWKLSGGTWTRISDANTNHVIFSLDYDAANNKLYAGGFVPATGIGFGVQVCATPNTSPTWIDIGAGVSNYSVRDICFDANHNLLYAGSSNFFTQVGYGVRRYDGSTWTDVSGVLANHLVDRLAYDPTNNKLYAGTGFFGVWENSFPSDVVLPHGTLQFVDREYYRTDGSSGNVLLDIDDQVGYRVMLDTFKPRPASQKQITVDSPLSDYSKNISALSKLIDVVVPLSIRIDGTDADDLRDKRDALLNEIRRDEIYLLYVKPYGISPQDNRYYKLNPAVDIDTDLTWSRPFQNAKMGIVTADLLGESPEGIVETLQLANSHYVGGAFKTPIGIVVLPADLKGDLRAACDVYVHSTANRFTDLILAQRRKYSPDYSPVVEPTVGTDVGLATRRSGDCRYIAPAGNLLLNPSWDTFTGTQSNPTFANWTKSVTGSGVIIAADSDLSSYSLCFAGPPQGGRANVSLHVTSDYITITNTLPCYIDIWANGWPPNGTPTSKFYYRVSYYDSGSNLLGMYNIYAQTLPGDESWHHIFAYINPVGSATPAFPANTAKIKLLVQQYGHNCYAQTQSLDNASVIQASVIDVSFPLSAHEGVVMFTGGFSFGASTPYDDLSIQAFLQDENGNQLTSPVEITNIGTSNPTGKFRELALLDPHVPDTPLPYQSVAENIDKTKLKQAYRIVTNSLNAQVPFHDDMEIIPTDGNVVTVSGWGDTDYLILDSTDGKILQSSDGTIDHAAVCNPLNTRGTPRFFIDPEGINMFLLTVVNVDEDHQLNNTSTLTLKWRPRYKVP